MEPSSVNPLVLVADDEPTMLELVTRHLKTMDNPKLEVIEASDGEQAWRLAREHLPDLVVLDVMMPGMSGWEVCRKIREDVSLAHTGVVMLTGIGENLNQMTSPLYGADAYIDKPFEFGELDEKVKGALSARASQREGVTRPAFNGVGGPAHVPDEGPKTEPMTRPKGLAKSKKPAVSAKAAKASTASKKGGAKKGSAKKASATKGTTKKASGKKSSAKKASTKKASTKKSSAKKRSAKKSAPKKSGAKKSARKK